MKLIQYKHCCVGYDPRNDSKDDALSGKQKRLINQARKNGLELAYTEVGRHHLDGWQKKLKKEWKK